MIRWHSPSIWSALLVSLTLWAAPGAAQTADKVCDPSDPKSCVQAIAEGQPAPFTGLLMTGRRAAKLGMLAEGCQDRIDLMVGEIKELSQVQLQGLQAMRQNDKDSSKLQTDLLMERLRGAEELFSPRWYERPAFVAVLTTVLAVATLAVAVKTIQVLK